MTDDAFWTPERIERLRRLRKDGATFSAIANDLGTTKNACISKYQRTAPSRLGRKPPPSRPWTKGQLEMLRASVESGVNLRTVAIVLDRSLAAVKHKANALGLKPPGVTVTLPASSRTAQSEGVRSNKAPIGGRAGSPDSPDRGNIVTLPVAVPRHNSAQPAADATTHDGIPFLRRGVFQCAFIAQKKVRGEPVRCCGKPVTKPGSSWCADHRAIVYRKVQVLEAAE